ncbi:MAG: hypothetical protein KDD63_13145 [Bacteroidetes bacterium]|nr:hypothetical protein [Bacteroidota bacterium]MCB0846552.1 hypothetical protein [Bacteroidota bacterium]MCB0853164.1 hypothetical protein [Bacteroidota bacterium]
MKKALLLTFFGFHLFCMIYTNIIIEEQVYHDFFLNEQVKGKALTALEHTGIFNDLFHIYSGYSGAETGYGFYAPNVSSQFMVLYTIKDSLGNPVQVSLPRHYSKEALTRYFTAFDLFMDKLDEQDEKYDKFMDIVMKSMALKVLEEHPPYTHIDADLLVYDLPYMEEFQAGKRPEYAHMLHYSYQLNP